MALNRAQAKEIIDVPPEKFFEVIADFEKYPEFIPEVKRAKVLEKKGNKLKVEYEVSVIKTIRYTLELTLEPPNRLSWTLAEKGFFKQNDGAWELKSIDGGKRTEATYTVEIAFGILVPKAIIKTLVSQNLPQMLKRFKERAESIYA